MKKSIFIVMAFIAFIAMSNESNATDYYEPEYFPATYCDTQGFGDCVNYPKPPPELAP